MAKRKTAPKKATKQKAPQAEPHRIDVSAMSSPLGVRVLTTNLATGIVVGVDLNPEQSMAFRAAVHNAVTALEDHLTKRLIEGISPAPH